MFVLDVRSQEPVPDQDNNKPVATKILEVGKVSNREFRETLAELWKSYDPTMPLYIAIYGTDKEITRNERIIVNSIDFRYYDRSRIVIVRAGGKVTKVIFWKVPPGADNPSV
jgi:hypothetical protein